MLIYEIFFFFLNAYFQIIINYNKNLKFKTYEYQTREHGSPEFSHLEHVNLGDRELVARERIDGMTVKKKFTNY